MQFTIAAIAGNTAGSILMEQAGKVLYTLGEAYGHSFAVTPVVAGTQAVELGQPPMPEQSLAQCKQADAVLLGKVLVGNHQHLPFEQRPESILNTLRKELVLVNDLRPFFLWPPLQSYCPLRAELFQRGMDIMVVRDIAGGMFCGDGCRCDDLHGRVALDTELYSEQLIRQSATLAFGLAQQRQKHVTSLDKAILLSSSVLWRQVVTEVAQGFPDVKLSHQFVDSAAQSLVEHSNEYDVILTSNVFGDIIADELCGLTGIGAMLPAASLAVGGKGLFYPNQLHDAVPQHPSSIMLAIAMMMEYSFGLKGEADSIVDAVRQVLTDVPNISNQEFGDLVCQQISKRSSDNE